MATSAAITCQSCNAEISEKAFLDAHKVCPECSYHYPMTAYERLELLVDKDSFDEHDSGLYSTNPLEFPDYEEQLASGLRKNGAQVGDSYRRSKNQWAARCNYNQRFWG